MLAGNLMPQIDAGVGSANAPIPEDQIKPESVLLMPGQKANETAIVRKADKSLWAYAWNSDSREWDTLGQVTGAAPSGGGSGNKTVRFCIPFAFCPSATRPRRALAGLAFKPVKLISIAWCILKVGWQQGCKTPSKRT